MSSNYSNEKKDDIVIEQKSIGGNTADTLLSPKIKGKYLAFDPNGDATIGDYSGGQGIFWDQSAGTLDIAGGLTVDSIDIPDTTTENSFHVDTSGNMWLGATTFSAAPARVSNTGAATFESVTINSGTNVSIQAPLELTFIAGEDLTAGDAVFTEDSSSGLTFTYKTITATGNSAEFGKATGAQKLAQSFQSSVGFNVNEVKVRLSKVGTPTDNVQASLQADSSGSPSGAVLVSGTVAGTSLTGSTVQYTITFSGTSSTLDANTTYWIVLERSSSLSDTHYYVAEDAVDTYADGLQKFYNGSTWANVTVGPDTTDFDLVVNGTGVAGYLYKTDADNSGQYETFIGFIKTTVSQGADATVVVNGEYTGLSGLSIGAIYYVSNTRGGVSSSPGTNSRKIGISTSETSMLIVNMI